MKDARWFFQIGKQLFKLVPGQTVLAMFLSLFSRAFELLSSYLPLKVVILLGSVGIPKFFPSSFQALDRELLVIGLSIATVIAYMLFVAIDKLIKRLNERATTYVLKSSSKMPLFSNQNQVAQKGIQRYSESLAELFFLTVGLPILGWFSPNILLFLVVYAALASMLYRRGALTSESDDSGEDKSRNVIIYLSDIGFLLVFIFMIYQALNDKDPNILILIITFLFLRRLQTSLKKLIFNSRALLKQEVQISALFFHEITIESHKKPGESLFWSLAQTQNVLQWASDVIEQLTGQKPKKIECNWFQSDLKDILIYRISSQSEDKQKSEYLVKLYNKKQTLAAQHESEMLLQVPLLPCLSLLAVENVRGFHCLLFRWHKESKVVTDEQEVDSLFRLYDSMMKVSVPEQFAEKYLRSHLYLPQRLDEQFWLRVQHVSESMRKSQTLLVNKLLTASDAIGESLFGLPTTVINHKLTAKMLLTISQDKALALHWANCSIEPIGAGWPVTKEGLNALDLSYGSLCSENNNFESIKENDIRLSALMYVFEQRINAQKFEQAFELIPSILGSFENAREGKT